MIAQGYIAAAIALSSLGIGFAGGLKWRDADLAKCEANVTARDHALEIQGAAVTRLAEASDEARRKAAEAFEAGRAAAKTAQARIDARKGLVTPRSCDAAMRMTDAQP